MLTRTGRAAVASGLALLVASYFLGYVELAALGIACLLAVGFALLWIQRRPLLDVNRIVDPQRVTADPANTDKEKAYGRVTITNRGTRANLPMSAHDRVGGKPITVAVHRMAPGASTTSTYRLPTHRRAVLDVGPLVVVRADPFGLVHVEQTRGGIIQAFVHPRRHPLLPLPASFERSLEGPTADSAPQGSQAFHQLREYVPGDDRRMIHWRSSARTGTLMVRQHVDTSLPDLTVVLDTRASQWDEESFEVGVEIAASLVATCTEHGFPVQLRTTDGQRFEAPMGQPALMFFLDRLAGVETTKHGDIVSVSQLLSQSAGGFALLVVTGRPSTADMRSLIPLVRRYSSVGLVDAHPDPSNRVAVPGVKRIEATSGERFAERWNAGVLR